MDTGSPYGNHTSVAPSTTSLAFSEKTLVPEDPRGSEQAPLVPSDSTNHKYEPEVFLQLYIDALRALQWEIHNAARVYHDCDGRFRDIERHVLNARIIYIHSLHLIDQEHHLARRAMDAQRKVESARSSGKSAYRKVFEKVRHGYRKWRLRSDVESDQMYIVALLRRFIKLE